MVQPPQHRSKVEPLHRAARPVEGGDRQHSVLQEGLVLGCRCVPLFSSLLHSSLELSDTQVYEPQIRALLGTASHFCQVVFLKLRTVPIGTALSLRILRGLSPASWRRRLHPVLIRERFSQEVRARGGAVQDRVGCRAGNLNDLPGEGPPHASHAGAHAVFSRVHCPHTHTSDSPPLEAPAPGCALGSPW